jgi:hypothetical protein
MGSVLSKCVRQSTAVYIAEIHVLACTVQPKTTSIKCILYVFIAEIHVLAHTVLTETQRYIHIG